MLKSQYEIILDVILEVCHSLPSSFSEVLARKISNELIDNKEEERELLRSAIKYAYYHELNLPLGEAEYLEVLKETLEKTGGVD